MRLITFDGFWVVHIPVVRMVKFDFFAQLSVDHLSYPILSSLILFCANLLCSLIVRLIVSSLSTYYLHLLFSCAVFALT